MPLPAACGKMIYVVATLAHKQKGLAHIIKPSFIDGYKSTFGADVRILSAVNGYNQTETLDAFLQTGLQFHNVSRGGRLWGKLAVFVTKYQMLMHQIDREIPYQVTFEDDLVMQPGVLQYLGNQCSWLDANPQVDVLQMSKYAEAMMTSLAGARRLVAKVRKHGILKNDDQQLLDNKIMGQIVSKKNACFNRKPCDRGGPEAAGGAPEAERPPCCWVTGRTTNRGDISATPSLTWAELALLRLLTRSPTARSLPNFGNPPGAEFGKNPYKGNKLKVVGGALTRRETLKAAAGRSAAGRRGPRRRHNSTQT